MLDVVVNIEYSKNRLRNTQWKRLQGLQQEYYPKCECKGTFIHDKKACPSCDSVLIELKVCAGYDKDYDRYEISQKCIDKVKVTIKYLEDCGYYNKKTDYNPTTSSKQHPVIVIKKPTHYPNKPSYPVHKPQHPVSSAFASASASAVASGRGSVAVADASALAVGGGSVATADAAALAAGGL